MLPLLPLDKSFAHAVSASELAALSRKCDFLVPSAFYYEIFDTKPAVKRRQTLAGLESFRRIDIDSLIRQEMATGQPIGEVKTPELHFNPKVLDPAWVLSDDEAAVQKQYEDHVVMPALAFWSDVIKEQQVIGFSTDELKAIVAPPQEFTALCQLLCARCSVPKRGGVRRKDVPKPEDLWDKYYTGAPARRRQCVGRSNLVKRA